MRKVFFYLLLCVNATPIYAQNEKTMSGAGVVTCKKYMETIASLSGNSKDVVNGVFESWIQGYVSGRNRQLDELGYKYVDIGKIEQLGAMLTFACGNFDKQGMGSVPLYMVIDKVYEETFSNITLKK